MSYERSRRAARGSARSSPGRPDPGRPDPGQPTALVLALVLALASTLGPGLAVSPARGIDFVEPGAGEGSGGRAGGGSELPVDFPGRLERAVEEIREHVRSAPACHAYFDAQGVDLDAWLEPGMPPYVVPRQLRRPGRLPGRSDRVCGAAQGGPPFEWVYVDAECFRHPRLCDLASLILHEMGHLARRDTRDREPREFFRACRLSACVDPGRYD